MTVTLRVAPDVCVAITSTDSVVDAGTFPKGASGVEIIFNCSSVVPVK